MRQSPRTATLVAGAGLVAYLAGLIAMLPAALAFDPGPRWALGGTLWRGEAVLGGAIRVEWRWAPLRSLANLGFAADWRALGGGTNLSGGALIAGERTELNDVSGQADGALLAAVAPNLPLACDMRIDVAIRSLSVGGGDRRARGGLRSGPARCAPGRLGTDPVALPPLVAVMRPAFEETEAWIAPAAIRTKLVVGRMSRRGRTDVAITPAGAALVPMLRGLRYTTQL